MKWYVFSVKEIVLEVNRHQRGVLSSTHHLGHDYSWHNLTIGIAFTAFFLLATCPTLISLVVMMMACMSTSLSVHVLSVGNAISYFKVRFKRRFTSHRCFLRRLRRRIVGGVYVVVNVTLIIPHGQLITSKSPITINYKLVLMDTSFQGFD